MCLSLDTIERKRLEKHLKKARDARLHVRLLALLALADGQTVEEAATLLRVCERSIRNWLQIYRDSGVKALLTLHHQGDPG
jgi:hypothetical protein